MSHGRYGLPFRTDAAQSHPVNPMPTSGDNAVRDDTKFLLDYLPQLEATFSYACLALSAGLLSPEQQESFGHALIHTGNRLVDHSTQPIEKTDYNTYEADAPRCWADTPY